MYPELLAAKCSTWKCRFYCTKLISWVFSCLLSHILLELLCHGVNSPPALSDEEGPPLEAASCWGSRQGCQLVSIVAIVLWYGHLSVGNKPETTKLIWWKPVNRHQLKRVSSCTPAIWIGLIRACVRLCKQKAMHCWQCCILPMKTYHHVGDSWCSGDGIRLCIAIVISRWGTTYPVSVESLNYFSWLCTLPARSHLRLYNLIWILSGKMQSQLLHHHWIN